jgi:hypothetical protein
MKYNLLWSGLADEKYYNAIAQYCLPSWTKLPGDKNIIHDSNSIHIDRIFITPWDSVHNKDSKFLLRKPSKKVWSFWRKMRSQVWAARTFKEHYDFVVLLDTDIEILESFDKNKLEKELEKFIDSNLVWATGRSQSRLHDSGFIVLNTRHELYNSVIDDYEDTWEGEDCKLSTLAKPYDGHAVESMFEKYPSYKIMNTDYGKGFHVYDLGLVHYGSKIPKSLRSNSTYPGDVIVHEYTKDIIVKRHKN